MTYGVDARRTHGPWRDPRPVPSLVPTTPGAVTPEHPRHVHIALSLSLSKEYMCKFGGRFPVRDRHSTPMFYLVFIRVRERELDVFQARDPVEEPGVSGV